MIMANFHIVLSTDEGMLRSQAAGGRSLILPVHIQVGSISFPDPNWDDFAVVILGWWAEQISTLKTKCINSAVFRFMDGPYEVRVVPDASEMCILIGIEDGLRASELFRASASLDEIMIEIVQKAEYLLQSLQKINLWDKDCDKLASLVTHISYGKKEKGKRKRK